MEYPFIEIEKKWQKIWNEKKIFEAQDKSTKEKKYILSMFPYPSGDLHMGHISNYSIGDALSRFYLQSGYNVMQPMGYDSFGMPAENFAIQHNSHPKITTEENIAKMKKQLTSMGFGLDWSRELSTCRPDYYKWGQWLFKRMYEKGLVYKKKSFVNWCPDCSTVLANEQVEEGKCWRCASIVVQKELEQWFAKITDYAEELLDTKDLIDWPEKVKLMQKNWIGRSTGVTIDFLYEEQKLPVFTTRPDTIFGVTFMAIAPEHPLTQSFLQTEGEDSKLYKFCQKVMTQDNSHRTAEDKEKEGIFTGRYCINPVNGDKVEIWITNYVLMDYGTGAVMAVPAHDTRDFLFARKYNINIKLVVQNEEKNLEPSTMQEAFIEDGTMVNSAQFDQMNNRQCLEQIADWIDKQGYGKKSINYKLRDWGLSRQRYWGNPIPVVYCEKCGTQLVPDEQLPVLLPDDVQIGKTKQNPLLSAKKWLKTTCPKCGGEATRETDTMDTFVDSSWYFARYCDSQNQQAPFNKDKANYWLPVDQYIGGIEHAVLHLLYARFFHKFMRDIGLVDCNEPFSKLLTQGMVCMQSYKCPKDGYLFPKDTIIEGKTATCTLCGAKVTIGNIEKMSKSKKNVVNPNDYLQRYGADTLRTFVLFASPPEKDVDWNDKAVGGAFRFLNRIYKIFVQNQEFLKQNYTPSGEISAQYKELRYSSHYTIKKASGYISEKLQFNTAIAAVMEHLNNLYSAEQPKSLAEKSIYKEAHTLIPQIIYPFAPHLCEEIWQMIGNSKLLHDSGLPSYEEKFLIKNDITLVIQVMGKIRAQLETTKDASKEEIISKAKEIANVQKFLSGKKILKEIIVPGKLVNFVVK